MNSDEKVKICVDRLKYSKKIFVITGAGVSAESGIPTFRGKDGYWKNQSPQKLASPEGFAEDPKLVWEWYDYRRRLIKGCEPNPAHYSLSKLERKYDHFLIATQNVDGLHQRASSLNVVEIHGSIWEVKCTKDGRVEKNTETPLKELPLRCSCGALMRPNVVWFGETLPEKQLKEIYDFIKTGDVDFTFVIGTSALFYYIIDWAQTVKNYGSFLVEINLDNTAISSIADIVFLNQAGVILPEITKQLI